MDPHQNGLNDLVVYFLLKHLLACNPDDYFLFSRQYCVKKQNLMSNVQMIKRASHSNGLVLGLDVLAFWLNEDLDQGFIVEKSDEVPERWEVTFGFLEEGDHKGHRT